MINNKNTLVNKALPLLGLTTFALLATGCTSSANISETRPAPAVSSEPKCKPYNVYAQNRWPAVANTDTYGAAVRPNPSRSGDMIASFAGNAIITVSGWTATGVQTYPQNPSPFNNDVWFKITDGEWVSYAGTRGAETEQNPNGMDLDGGQPAELKPECEIK